MVEGTPFKPFDELDVRSKPEISSFLDKNEKVLFAGPVLKINKHLASQERILIITDKFLYNICLNGNILNNLQLLFSSKSALKRKIEINKIFEITLSVHPKSEQFIIHVKDDYDYRYDGIGKREKIIQAICTAYFDTGKLFTFYLQDMEDLAAFHTNDDDFKVRNIKKPLKGKVMLTKQLFDRGLDHIIENRAQYMMDGSGDNSHMLKAHSVMLGDTNQEPLNFNDHNYSKIKSFESSKPIHSIEDIPMTSSGFVPKSSIPIQSNNDPMTQVMNAKNKYG